jgi:hypothetical protein
MNGEIFIKKNSKKLKQVCQILSLNFKKPIELELTRIYYPYLDSNIFVNFLALMINKKKVRHIMKKFFKKAAIKNLFKFVNQNKNTNVPSLLSGIKILIAGRLLTHKAIPRKTVKIIKRGAFAKSKVNYVDIARYTNKNRRGAFSITVTTGQNLFI